MSYPCQNCNTFAFILFGRTYHSKWARRSQRLSRILPRPRRPDRIDLTRTHEDPRLSERRFQLTICFFRRFITRPEPHARTSGYLVDPASAEAKEIVKQSAAAPDPFEYIEKLWLGHDGITETGSDLVTQYGTTREACLNLCSKQRYVEFFELEDGG
jgi:hypothetical protein